MKKSLIATAGVAAFAVAAVPFSGVFAANSTVTDVIKVSLDESCTITSQTATPGEEAGTGNVATTNTYAVTMHVGQVKSDIGDTATQEGAPAGANNLQVSCNTADESLNTWRLTAVGASETTGVDGAVNAMAPTTTANRAIATGTATSGATSNWAMRVTGNNIQNGFGTFRTVPNTATEVATGAGSTTTSFKMNYQVYIAPDTPADTYTGKVLYTLINPYN